MILTTPHFTKEQISRWIEWFELAAFEARELYESSHNEWALREWKECELQAERLKGEL